MIIRLGFQLLKDLLKVHQKYTEFRKNANAFTLCQCFLKNSLDRQKFSVLFYFRESSDVFPGAIKSLSLLYCA